MKLRTKLKMLVGALAIGGLVAYLFDPVAGASRRERFTRALEHRAEDLHDVEAKADRVVEAVTETADEPMPEPNTTAESA